jgi:hypothetical protein
MIARKFDRSEQCAARASQHVEVESRSDVKVSSAGTGSVVIRSGGFARW